MESVKNKKSSKQSLVDDIKTKPSVAKQRKLIYAKQNHHTKTSKSSLRNLSTSNCGSDSSDIEGPAFEVVFSPLLKNRILEEGECSSSDNSDEKECDVNVSDKLSPKQNKLHSSEQFDSSECIGVSTSSELTFSSKKFSSELIEAALEDGELPSEHDHDELPFEHGHAEISNEQSAPPLVMQSTNLPTEDGLDVGHDGGGLETSNDEGCEEPTAKKQKMEHNSTDSSSTPETICATEQLSVCDHNYSMNKQIEKVELENEDNDQSMDIEINDQSRIVEFDILDEFECNDEKDDIDEQDSDIDSDISLDELDALLEASLENTKLAGNASGQNKIGKEDFEHEEKKKVILKVRGRDHFDVLPEGWIEVTHNSGMPVYLHKATRVCCMSKPYFLGPGSTRKHEVPVSAIPCLHYLKEIEKEKSENTEETEENGSFPLAKLESVKDTKESGSLDFVAVREYCQKRFEFQTITVKRFKTWAGRRLHQKRLKDKQRPTLPDNTKLITCPLPPVPDKVATNGNNSKREFIMNPSGKSPVCILHEYVQHTLKFQPRYIFKELENASTPYGAVVMINGMEYGSGYGSSKKQAKSEAAKAALDILIPKMKMFTPEGEWEEQQDVEFFDQVRVEDPRVCELSVKAGQPYPYQILLECLKRNYGMGDTKTDFKMRNLKHQKNEFVMTVGKHTASVVCRNKRDGKQRASQAILQMLHPHITSWGSLLRMYGKGSVKTLKEKKEAEQRITELQSQACANKPNISILNKLKEEMLKYREKMKSKKPIGKLIPEQMNLSTSDSNLKNVEL